MSDAYDNCLPKTAITVHASKIKFGRKCVLGKGNPFPPDSFIVNRDPMAKHGE